MMHASVAAADEISEEESEDVERGEGGGCEEGRRM